jgi:polygalacturonase
MSIIERSRDRDRFPAVKPTCKSQRLGHATNAIVEQLEKRYLLNAPILPTIPTGSGHLFEATSYGAVGDGTTDNTTAIQDAITACNAAGGGTVELTAAAGDYECGVINMESNVNLQIDSGAVLQATAGLVASVWIKVNGITNWEISGLGSGSTMGTLDGHSGGAAGNLNMININGSTIGLIQNLNVDNSPHEHIQCGAGLVNNVTINGVDIDTSATAANTDGIDPAGQNWLIENCTISDGDDDIAVKPENQYCANIDIQNCTILAGHGISVGGETNAGLNNMTVNNVTFNGTTNGLRLKADRGNGGLVENVSYSNITMTGVEYPILIDSYYNQNNDFPTDPYTDTGSAVNATTPIWENISFTNITSTDSASNSVAAAIYGLPEAPIENMSFTNVNITANTGMQIEHVRNTTFSANSVITVTSGNDLIGAAGNTYPTPADAQITEAGYINTDIDSPTVPFDTSESVYNPDNGDWTINGSGAGITGTADQYNYTYDSITGNAAVSAELTSLAVVSGATPEAGVMFRASTNDNDPFAAVVQTTAGQILFEWRASSGAAVQTSSPVSVAVGSTFVEVVRVGNNFGGYYSTNGGASYTQVGSTEAITGISAAANAGLAVSSTSNGNESQATFSDFAMGTIASQLAYAVQPSNVMAGIPDSPSIVVDLEDSNGNLVTSNDSDVTLSVATGPGIASGTLTVAAVNGVATFNTVIFSAIGAYTLEASDGSLTTATSNSFTVSAGTAAQLAFVQQPSSTTAGIAISPAITVDVEDQYGNVVTSNSSNVTLAVSSGPGTLSGTTTVAAVNGVATFSNATIDEQGNYQLSASDSGLTGATSGSFNISPAAASKVVLFNQPQNAQAGNPIVGSGGVYLTVLVEDQYGNQEDSNSSNVTLAVATGPGTLTGTTTVAAVEGQATFSNIEIDTGGTYTLQATDTGLTSATTSSFTITAATQLAFVQQPTNVPINDPISPAITVELEDQFGDLASTNTSNVTLTVASGPGSLTGTTTVAAVNGIATFSDVAVNASGNYTIEATDGALTAAVSNSFTVSIATAAKLAFIQQPTNTAVDTDISPSIQVAVENAQGQVVTTDSSYVTVDIATGPSTNGIGNLLTVQAVNGVATFNSVFITDIGTYTLSATDGSLTSAISSSFDVSPGPAAQMVIAGQHLFAAQYGPVSLETFLVLEDEDGDVVTNNDSDVTVTAQAGGVPVGIAGQTTAAVVDGVAEFHSLTPTVTGTVQFTFTDGSLTASETGTFDVLRIPLKFRDWYGSISLPYSESTSQVLGQIESSEPSVVSSPAATVGPAVVAETGPSSAGDSLDSSLGSDADSGDMKLLD